jgi:hypothetical protein
VSNKDDEFEYQTRTLVIDANLAAECEKLQKGGWEITPGALPVAIYHLRKRAASPAVMAEGGVTIDDSMVTIIRGNGAAS